MNFECATVRVPLDYAQPSGRKIAIAISRIRATDPDARRGVLLMNPGGPGGSGLTMPVTKQLPDEVSERYDLIGFDPRGIGASTPITCGLGEDGGWFPSSSTSRSSTSTSRGRRRSRTTVGPLSPISCRTSPRATPRGT